jgi:hypothetical protein
MTTTERDPAHGGYEAASERRSEQKEPPMTKTQDEKTQDELKAAVERIERDLSFADATAKKHGGTVYRSMFSVSDLRLILAALRSPEPEVERLRGAVSVMSAALERIAGGNPGNTNSATAKDMSEWSHCVAVVAMCNADVVAARAALSSNSGGR